MAVIGFSVIRYVDPFQGAVSCWRIIANTRFSQNCIQDAWQMQAKKTGHMARFSVWQLLTQ
ncbi:MAG: hypothetical protein BEH78_08140 [Pseudomonas sp. BDAL1]|nr:MAG: hypothetical protein BEH78_08140 [Pseudomonas sp. BDAL1]